MTMPMVNHKQIEQLINLYKTTNTPLMIHGRMGIGKSEIARAFALTEAHNLKLRFSEAVEDYGKKECYNFIVINMQHLDAVDMKGIPVIENGATRFIPTNMLPSTGQGVLFFDELNLAVPMVLNACYQIFLDRRILDRTIPKEFVLISAGNLSDDSANTFDLPAPLKDRMAHVHLSIPTVKEWVDNYALKAGVDGRVINYLLASEDKFHTYKPDSDEVLFATPRSWKKLSDNIGKVSSELFDIVAGSIIGVGIAREFSAFVELAESYNVAEIFEKGGKFTVPKNIDGKYAFISAVVAYYHKIYDKHSGKNIPGKIVETLYNISKKFDAEYSMVLYRLCAEKDKNFFTNITSYMSEAEQQKVFNDIVELAI